MVGLDKCSGSCNLILSLLLYLISKCLVSKNMYSKNKQKKVNVEVFNMITIRNKAKTIANHVLCDCKCKFNSIQFN